MSDKLTTRFEQEPENIKSSLSKKRGVKEESAVNRRIGRLQQKYPSISKLYAIALKAETLFGLFEIMINIFRWSHSMKLFK
ncbi:MAG: hypothetical protein LBG96_15480, partial [Tannerella sp.]|nr:hypothetical protein [Tannerella sp.]